MITSMLRRAMLSGDGSTLNLDFTQMSTLADLTSRGLTFSRSTSGTYINASGLVATATAGNPRFDYDPTTLQPRGLLIEGSANNLALRSDDFNSTLTDGTQWATSGYTSGTLSTTLPDGTTGNARRLSIASGAGSFRSAAITVLASTAYTFSFWARNNGGSQARYRVWNVSAGSSIVDYTLSGSNYVSQIGGANNTSSTWVRVSVSFTTPVGCTSIYVYPCSSDSGTVDLLVWGAQVELGSGASSYIPTGASTGSRAADSCVMTGTNFSSWFAGATEGVFFSEYEAPRSLGSADYFCLGTQYAAGNFIGLSLNNANRYPQASISPGGGFRISGPITTTATTPMKHAAKWSGVNNILVIANGVVGSTHAATTGTPSLTMFSIGSSSSSGTAATGDYLNACVRRVKFWPTALSNAQIIALTT